MKVFILDNERVHHSGSQSLRRAILEAGLEDLGIEYDSMDIGAIQLELGHRHAIPFGHRHAIPPPIEAGDVVFYVPVLSTRMYEYEVLQTLGETGAVVINPPASIMDTTLKHRMLRRLHLGHIPIPHTVIVWSHSQIKDAIDFCGGLPIVTKSVRGHGGIGIAIMETERSLRSWLDWILAREGCVILQEFVDGAGSDLKIVATRAHILAGFRRRASRPGEFRGNVSQGGSEEVIVPSEEIKRLAKSAVSCLGLVLGSVDVIQTGSRTVVLEVNETPELHLNEAGCPMVDRHLAVEFVRKIIASVSANEGSCELSRTD